MYRWKKDATEKEKFTCTIHALFHCLSENRVKQMYKEFKEFHEKDRKRIIRLLGGMALLKLTIADNKSKME